MNASPRIAAIFDRTIGAAATPAPSLPAEGSGAPRARLVVFAAALIALALPAAASAAEPTLTLDPVTTHNITTAHLSGTLDPADNETFYCFEVSTEAPVWPGFCYEGPLLAGAGPTPLKKDLSGLKPGTEYAARLTASNFIDPEVFSEEQTFTTDPAVEPQISLDPPSENLGTSAHFSGSIDPNGGNTDTSAGVLPISWQLLLSRDGEGFYEAASDTLSGAQATSTDPVAIEADPSLVPSSSYQYQLVVHYAGLEKSTPVEAFEAPPAKATIERETLWEPTQTSIQLNARVNPHNETPLSECHFAYGVGESLDQSTPCEASIPGDPFTLPSEEAFTTVSARIFGLTPGTKYSFRLVATNSSGITEGEPRSFTTRSEPIPQSCPNQAFRDNQKADYLPDCRAYEMVTPLEKGNGDIVGDGATTIAATDGNGVAFSTRSNFGDTVGTAVFGQSQYLARRSAGSWTSHAITPMSDPEAVHTFITATAVQLYSEDLNTAVVRAYDLPESSDDEPLRNQIYLEDTATRALQPITVSQVDRLGVFEFINYPTAFWGISADARHVAFVSQPDPFNQGKAPRFLPSAAPGVPNLYQSDDGVLHLVGILPDGTVPPGGSNQFPTTLRGAVSADGARTLFNAVDPDVAPGGQPQLYQRIDNQRTVWISEPEDGLGVEPSGVQLQGATPDGRSVFFSTDTPLLAQDTNGGTDLYRYTDSDDPSTDSNLTMISKQGDFGNGDLLGISDDGDRVYYRTTFPKLLVSDHGVSRLVAGVGGGSGRFAFDLTGSPGSARVSPDGMFLAFTTAESVDPSHDGYSLTGKLLTNPHREMYQYDLDNDALSCISCPAELATADVTVLPAATDGRYKVENAGFRPRFLAADGSVVFSTAEPLLPADTNGFLDAYRYDPRSGELSLLSSGTAEVPSTFADAGVNGDDVIIATRDALTAGDTDDFVDLYDVRVGGGLPEPLGPPAEPCVGQACQGSPPALPDLSPPGSQALGRGNVVADRPRCRRHGHARHRRSSHCKKRKSRHSKRPSKDNRRPMK